MFNLTEYSTLNVVLSALVAVACGLVIAITYAFKNKDFGKNLFISLTVIPVVAQLVIFMISGGPNPLGLGIAVAGAFNLIRYRSLPGSSRDIALVFMSMAVGITTGIGEVGYAIIFTGFVCFIFVAFKFIPFDKIKSPRYILKVTVPEELDFDTEFKSIFEKYTNDARRTKIKTSKMGSLYQIDYDIDFKKEVSQKQMMDEMRVINGNLPIIILEKQEEKEF